MYSPSQHPLHGQTYPGMGMAPGAHPIQHGGHPSAVHVAPSKPSVIPTKHVMMPAKISSHHVNNTSDILYDIDLIIEEYFPDGSKAEHKHKFSASFVELKKIHDVVHHGGLVKDESKLRFPSTHLFELRKESDKRVAERMSELKVYFDTILKEPKVLTDKTFIAALHCDQAFELHLKHTADYMKLMKKKGKKDSKIKKKADKEYKKDMKKADKFKEKQDKQHEEQYHKALKNEIFGVQPGMPGAMPMGTPGMMPGMPMGTPMGGHPGMGMPHSGSHGHK